MTEPEFKALVTAKIAGGIPYALAVYQAIDEAIAAQGDKCQFACKKGCHFCCYQIVTATVVEMEVIITFIQHLPKGKRRRMLRKAFHRADIYHRWFQDNRLNRNFSNPLWIAEQWLGKACSFLSPSGVCWIYPVRPMDCRTAYSLTPCGALESHGAIRMPYECERWANNLVLEEQQRRGGRMEVVFLPHWLLIHRQALEP